MSQLVSTEVFRKPYACRVRNHYKTPLNWGAKYRQAIKLKGLNLASVAEKLGIHEATVRSWTNGHRNINLSDFLTLCKAGGVEPWPILFPDVDEKALALLEAWRQATDAERQLLTVAVEAVLRNHDQTKGVDRASDSS
jgi:transcriptional regulator with XRE-family HTH domain